MKSIFILFAIVTLTWGRRYPELKGREIIERPYRRFTPNFCNECKRAIGVAIAFIDIKKDFDVDQLYKCPVDADGGRKVLENLCVQMREKMKQVINWYKTGIKNPSIICAKLGRCEKTYIIKPWGRDYLQNIFQKKMMMKQPSNWRKVAKILPAIRIMKLRNYNNTENNGTNGNFTRHGHRHGDHRHHRGHHHRGHHRGKHHHGRPHHRGHHRHGGHYPDPTEIHVDKKVEETNAQFWKIKSEEEIKKELGIKDLFDDNEDKELLNSNENSDRIDYEDDTDDKEIDEVIDDLSLPAYDDPLYNPLSFPNLSHLRNFQKRIFNIKVPDIPKIKMPDLLDIKLPETETSNFEIPDLTKALLGEKWTGLENLDDLFGKTNKMMEKLLKNVKKTMTVFKSFSTNSDGNIKCAMCNNLVEFLNSIYEMIPLDAFEKAIKEKCETDDNEDMKVACDIVSNKIDTIIDLLKNNTSTKEICSKIGISNCTVTNYMTTSIMTSSSVHKPKPTCNMICNQVREELLKMNNDARETMLEMKETLTEFCSENRIIKAKCKSLLFITEKALNDLDELEEPIIETDVEDIEEPMIQTENGENLEEIDPVETPLFKTEPDTEYWEEREQENKECQCFSGQDPVSMDSNQCDICKMFENGLKKKVNETLVTVEILAKSLEENICPFFTEFKDECVEMVEDLRELLEERAKSIDGLCERLGMCKNDTSEDGFQELIKKSIMQFKDTFSPFSSFMIRGSPMGFFGKKLSMGCQFCETCMKNIEDEFKTMNTTEIIEAIPTIKNTFGIVCKTVSENEKMKSICKTMVDGFEKITEKITKQKNRDELCKAMDLC